MSQRTLGFRGVYRRPDKRWQAQLQLNGKNHDLGCFDDESSAAHAYDRAAKQAYAVPVLNFLEDGTVNPERKSRGPRTSRFRGVCSIGSVRWVATISVNSRKLRLGTYTDEREAAKAYDRAAKQYQRWSSLNFPDDEVCDVSAEPSAMVHQEGRAVDREDLGWSSSDEDEGGPGQPPDGVVPLCQRSRSSSGAVAIASPHSPTATAASPATHGQIPIDLTSEENDPGESLKGLPFDTFASTAAPAVSSSSSLTSTPAAPSAAPASSVSSAAATSISSYHEVHAGTSKTTGDAVEQLYHAVMKARMDARDTQQKAMLRKACAIFSNHFAADAVLAFARRTIANAFGAVDLSIEEHRTTVVEMFIEQLVEE